MNSTKTERTEIIDRIANLINIYAADEQTIRELERIILGWLSVKRKLRMKQNHDV